MIFYNTYQLQNGLRVVLHKDPASRICAVDIAYNAGSKYDPEGMTGMAHLFEHMMFTGSKNVADFDDPQQRAGGENNAFTNADYTHYYQTIPPQNLDIALWLEADRMFDLNLNKRETEIQKQVVVEEYAESVVHVPFGDVWHHLAPLCYEHHGYRWPTIGRNTAEILSIEPEDLRRFYNAHYHPENAVLAIASPLDDDKILSSLNKYFDKPKNSFERPVIPVEPHQSRAKVKRVPSPVPGTMIFMAFHIPGRLDFGYYVADLITDILANGPSALLYEELLHKRKIFSHIDAYISGTDDPGLLIVEGRMQRGYSADDGIEAVFDLLDDLKEKLLPMRELEKWINKMATSYLVAESKPVAKAITLAQMMLLGKPELINAELDIYKKIQPEDVREWATRLLSRDKLNALIYEQKG